MNQLKTMLKKYPLILLAGIMLWSIFLADILVPDRVFSAAENRYLQQSPTMDMDALINNEWTLKFETYVNDQFIGRDGWIDLKSRAEAALLKIENNGIVYGEQDYMFDKYTTYDAARFERNIGFIHSFAESYDGHVTFAVVPSAYAVLPDYLPEGAPQVDQLAIIRESTQQMGGNVTVLDLAGALGAHGDEYIYCRTDPHWTTQGAYYAYETYAVSRGMTPVDLSTLTPHTVEGFLGTHYNKCKKFDAVADTITYYDIPVGSVEIPVRSEDIKDADIDGLYNHQKFEAHDKYAAFLWGNNALTIIQSADYTPSPDTEPRRLLLIKDSYSNAIAPFLLCNYDEIYMVDLRFSPGIEDLLAEYTFEDVFICYAFTQLSGDMNVAKLQ